MWTLTFFVLICARVGYTGASITLDDLDEAYGDFTIEYYDRLAVIPLQNQADTMNVSISMGITNLLKMDVSTGRVTFSGYFQVAWTEERYTGPALDTTIHAPAQLIWIPDIRIVSTTVSSIPFENDLITFNVSSNRVTWKPTVHVTTACSSNVFFPFEEHRCALTLTSDAYDTAVLQLFTNNTEISTADFAENIEWKLKSTAVKPIDDNDTLALEFSIVVQRVSASFYVNLILTPMLAVGVIQLFAFGLPRGTDGSRLALASRCSCLAAIILLVTYSILPRATSPVPIVTYFILVELIISILVTIAIVLLERHSFTDPDSSSDKPHDGAQTDSKTHHRNTLRRRNLGQHKGRTGITEVMSVWGNDTAIQDDNQTNVDDRSERETGICSADTLLCVVFLALHLVITLGFVIAFVVNVQ